MAETTMSDGLSHYNFRKGEVSYEDFLKSFTETVGMKTVCSQLTTSDLAELFAKLEILDLRVATILMNAHTYVAMRKWGRDLLDIETRVEELKKGLMGMIWGAKIIVNRKIPDATVVATSEDQFNTCATLQLGQEEQYNLKGLSALREKTSELSRELNIVYTQIEELISNSLLSLKKEKDKRHG
jgi:hypothetical protein